MNNYQKRKAAAIEAAINWQDEFVSRPVFWSELAEKTERFEKLAKRYGLRKLFRENGII